MFEQLIGDVEAEKPVVGTPITGNNKDDCWAGQIALEDVKLLKAASGAGALKRHAAPSAGGIAGPGNATLTPNPS